MAEIKVTSAAFKEGEMIPAKYTCSVGAQEVSPPLAWEGIPAGAKSIALIADDPDAPGKTWVHWVVWNIPADKKGLPEAVPKDGKLPDGTCQGISDFGKPGYGGPCPPSGTHHYYFKVYALDTALDLRASTKKPDLEQAMKGHVLAQGQLMGKYKK